MILEIKTQCWKFNLLIFLLLSFFVFSACAKYRVQSMNNEIVFCVKNDSYVEFLSQIDGFKPHKMTFDSGCWKIKIVNPKREFSYFFRDKNGILDIDCEFVEEDDFGNKNCIYSDM